MHWLVMWSRGNALRNEVLHGQRRVVGRARNTRPATRYVSAAKVGFGVDPPTPETGLRGRCPTPGGTATFGVPEMWSMVGPGPLPPC